MELAKNKNTLSGKQVLDHLTLIRQVSIESGASVDIVHRVLEALWSCVRKNLILGYRVRVNGLGVFMRLQKYSQSLERADVGTCTVVTHLKLDKEMTQARIEHI